MWAEFDDCIYKRPESLRRVSVASVVEGGEGINWRATGMGRWGAIGRRRCLCACVYAWNRKRREKNVFRIRARASGEERPEGMASSAQATSSTRRCWRSGGGGGSEGVKPRVRYIYSRLIRVVNATITTTTIVIITIITAMQCFITIIIIIIYKLTRADSKAENCLYYMTLCVLWFVSFRFVFNFPLRNTWSSCSVWYIYNCLTRNKNFNEGFLNFFFLCTTSKIRFQNPEDCYFFNSKGI